MFFKIKISQFSWTNEWKSLKLSRIKLKNLCCEKKFLCYVTLFTVFANKLFEMFSQVFFATHHFYYRLHLLILLYTSCVLKPQMWKAGDTLSVKKYLNRKITKMLKNDCCVKTIYVVAALVQMIGIYPVVMNSLSIQMLLV